MATRTPKTRLKKGLMRKTTLHVQRTFWYIFLPSLHDHDVKFRIRPLAHLPQCTLFDPKILHKLWKTKVMQNWDGGLGGGGANKVH